MSEGPSASGSARRVGSGTVRVARAWRALPHESRLAAFASAGLFVTLFLPWYQVTLIATAKSATLQSASATITGWGAFSFVEAAVLLVAAAVVILLFQRAEGRAFHMPGGDGGVITAAGLWTCVLIVWRIFDKQGATTKGPSATTSGIEWGIFIALAAAAFLAYSGSRIRAAHRPEPPLPGSDGPPAGSSAAATTVRMRRPEPAAPDRPRRRARPPIPVPADPPTHALDPPTHRLDPPTHALDPPTHALDPPTRALDPPTRALDPPTRALDPPTRVADPPSPPADPPPARPSRRATAAELFERVIPDDPPTMPFGRAKRSDADITIRRQAPQRADEQLTIPFAGNEDETLALGEDATVPLGDDDTLPLDR